MFCKTTFAKLPVKMKDLLSDRFSLVYFVIILWYVCNYVSMYADVIKALV